MLGRLYWVSVELEASLAPAEAEVGTGVRLNNKEFKDDI